MARVLSFVATLIEQSTPMPATISKADIQKVIREMPSDDMNLDDFIERVILLSKVRSALEQEGEGISQAQVIQEFKKPRNERKWN